MQDDLLDDQLFKIPLSDVKEYSQGEESFSIDWQPLNGGGTNVKTHTLQQFGNSMFEFKTTIGAIVFALVFMLPGIGTIIGGVVSFNFFLLLHGSVFFLAGYYMLFTNSNSSVFDLKKGICYRKKSSFINYHFKGIKQDEPIQLSTVKGIQLLKERVRGDKSSYNSYEINFIFENGERYNLIDHGSYASSLKDARTIAAALKVPFYNGVAQF